MTDMTEVVLVTAVAVLALGVLVRPLLSGRKSAAPAAKSSCASCSAEQGPKPAH